MENELRGYFHPLQAREVAEAFGRFEVEYLFIGKSGAILLGFPGATQDVDLFVKKSKENGRRKRQPRTAIEIAVDGTSKEDNK